jgi:cyclophilin family peptidyl-prolyl cis-trans isomerase
MRRGLSLLLAVLGLAVCSAQSDEKPAAPAAPPTMRDHPGVTVTTSLGSFDLELDAKRAPGTVENFLQYVDAGFYDGTIFHRVIPGFMIQGGGFDGAMKQKSTRAPIQNEATNGVKNETGSVAMARTSDPNSATAQFFVNLVDNEILNHGGRDFGYAVFARVSSGLDVVQKIAAAPTGSRGGHQNVPLEAVVIESIRRK